MMNLDRRLTALAREEGKPFAGALFLLSLSAAMALGQAFALSGVISGAFMDHQQLAALLPLIAMFAAFSLLRAILSFLGQASAAKGSLLVRGRLFGRLLEVIALRGPLYTRQRASGRLTTTMLSGVERLDPYFSQYIPQLAIALAGPLLILMAVMPSDPVSGLILLFTAPLIPLFMALIGRQAKAMSEAQWESLSRMGGRFLDMLQGLTTLKLLAMSQHQEKAIEEAGESFRKSTMKVLRVAFLSSLALELVGTIGTAMVAVGIGLRLMEGQMPLRTAFFVLLLTPEFYLPLRQLGLKFHAGMEGTSASKDIHDVLEAPPAAVTAQRSAAVLRREAFATSPIRLEQAACRYEGHETDALGPVDLELEAGRIIALTGPSGAGKSTLASLLLRFQEPSGGRITFDGRPLQDYDLEAWQAMVAWVPQHPFLFNATLGENIMMARRGAGPEALERAIANAGLERLVASLPEGTGTMLGEGGARLSGGEAQRVALARAFLKDSPLIVLDEPTAHTDPLLEAGLNATMQALMQHRTALVISHSLRTTRTADRIIVLERGRIAASGTHRELAAGCPFYRTAFTLQGGRP